MFYDTPIFSRNVLVPICANFGGYFNIFFALLLFMHSCARYSPCMWIHLQNIHRISWAPHNDVRDAQRPSVLCALYCRAWGHKQSSMQAKLVSWSWSRSLRWAGHTLTPWSCASFGALCMRRTWAGWWVGSGSFGIYTRVPNWVGGIIYEMECEIWKSTLNSKAQFQTCWFLC